MFALPITCRLWPGLEVPIQTFAVVSLRKTFVDDEFQGDPNASPVIPVPSPENAVAVMVPMTCRLEEGVAVPMPTLPSEALTKNAVKPESLVTLNPAVGPVPLT